MILLFKSAFFLGAITSLLLGIFIYFQNRSNLINKTYAGLSACCAIWSFGFWGMILADKPETALLWRLFMESGSVFIPAFWLHFVYAFLGITYRVRTILPFYIFSFFLLLINLSDLLGYGLFSKIMSPKLIFAFYPTAGIGYYLFFFYFIFTIFHSFYLLINSYRKNLSSKHKQIKYLIIAALLGFAGGGMTFLLTFNIYVVPFGVILFAFYPMIVGYAITTLQLFNIKVVATQMLVSTLSIFILVRTIIADNFQERLINGILFVTVSVLGIFVVRSVLQEVRQREEIERLAKDLAAANERLKELDQLKSEFVSIASHQLRSPLTAIKGYASLIMDGSFGIVPKAINEAVDKIFASAEHLVLVVEDFLNVSRIEQGRMKYDFVETDLETLVKEVVEGQKTSADRAKLSLIFTSDQKGPYKTKVDIGKIRQVITNLVDNSIKYTPSGSVSVKIERVGNNIRLAVKDTGVGIDKETINQLFEKFTRAKDASKTNVSGTGLGLYVAKQMVEAHKGKIWAESDGRGKGSTFYVELKAL